MNKKPTNIVTTKQIPTLSESYSKFPKPTKELEHAPDRIFNDRISLWQGDMTILEIDAIVNAANESLLGGGGIDGAIHRAAGRELLAECRKLNGCPTGRSKITKGYKLPARFVIHTVGPQGEYKDKLAGCYKSVLDIVKEKELTTVAFCCVSTGIYGYDNLKAANVALETVGNWLRENYEYSKRMERIVFCTFLDKDLKIYEKLLPEYFPKPCTDGAEGTDS
ncbi:O-acetyl-ADP-ribose deacetylase macrod1 [Entomortierella chlamydospora]|uniref:O-acetyl-ADP-ribose deacetylase macrod1 n=1 Tax=Entomortierella chlamydospora TaxID=101097 RepID=A0A9P6SZY7_9FUNG|nr:O-acetyl-ADP-ribose deacetylase macrod1 [Entomortierella chlamydospora]